MSVLHSPLPQFIRVDNKTCQLSNKTETSWSQDFEKGQTKHFSSLSEGTLHMNTECKIDFKFNPEKSFLSGDTLNEWPNKPVEIVI